MKRRAFIAGIGSVAAWPMVGRGQRAIPVVGWLGIAPESSNASRLGGVRSGLRDVGYVEGTNVAFEFRWAESLDQLPKLAAELVKDEVAVMIATGNAATRAARLQHQEFLLSLRPQMTRSGSAMLSALTGLMAT
jgi:putative ABC transport system substrate-binding protein